jgi:hypothetical protein
MCIKITGTCFSATRCAIAESESAVTSFITEAPASIDAIATYRIYKWLKDDLVPKQQQVYDTYKKYVIPVIPVFVKISVEALYFLKVVGFAWSVGIK